MSITQFNATYVKEEDRVLFRFNTSESLEYRLWLTRQVVADLLRVIVKGSVEVVAREHPVEHAKAIVEFKQQAKAANPQFTTFVPATKYPLGAEPVLVHSLRLTMQTNHLSLEMMIPKGQVLTMRLTEDMLSQMRLLLQTIEQRADWGLSSTIQHASIPSNSSKTAALEPEPTEASKKLLH
jgi:ribosomal protein L10